MDSRRLQGGSYWRNLLVVFLISFAALGTLRLRTTSTRRSRHPVAATSLQTTQQQQNTRKKSMVSSIVYRKVPMDSREQSDVVKYAAFDATSQQPLSVFDWAQRLGTNRMESQSLIDTLLLQAQDYKSFFFETPPVTQDTIDAQRMEFVLIDAPHLYRYSRRPPDMETFQAQFDACQTNNDNSAASPVITSFSTLSGDALLIVPCPPSDKERLQAYTDLAAFVQLAKQDNGERTNATTTESFVVHWTLSLVARTYLARVDARESSTQPLWLSTSGWSVAYLHFRLDNRPRNFSLFYEPYTHVVDVTKEQEQVAARLYRKPARGRIKGRTHSPP